MKAGTPLRIADGVHYTGTVKRADHAAELLREIMKDAGVYDRSEARQGRQQRGGGEAGRPAVAYCAQASATMPRELTLMRSPDGSRIRKPLTAIRCPACPAGLG